MAPTSTSTVLNGSEVVNTFCQTLHTDVLASIVRFCQTNVVNIPFSKGERWKKIALGTVDGWTQDIHVYIYLKFVFFFKNNYNKFNFIHL